MGDDDNGFSGCLNGTTVSESNLWQNGEPLITFCLYKKIFSYSLNNTVLAFPNSEKSNTCFTRSIEIYAYIMQFSRNLLGLRCLMLEAL